MAGACVSVNLNEIEALARRLNSYELSPADEKALLNSVGVEIKGQMFERFYSTKTDPEGNEWAALAKSTKKFLAKYYPKSRPPLWRTGSLMDTLDVQGRGGMVKIGATKKYAGYIQDGTKKMPARAFAGLSSSDIEELAEIIDVWLKERFK